MYYYSKDASCCSGVCVHCKLFHLSISPSAAPSTRPTGSSSMGFWGSLLASDKTLQIKKNTLKRAICAFKVLSEEFFASHLDILLSLHKNFELIRTNCLICCDDGLILDPKSTYVLCSLKMIRSSIQLRACHNISVQQSLRYSDLILVFSKA